MAIFKHGESGTRLYNTWNNMIARCYREKNRMYFFYGKRGIVVCDEWKDFLLFKKWALDNGYDDTLTIERIDVKKGYNPNNCEWIPPLLQYLNTSRSLQISVDEASEFMECQERTGISGRAIGRFLKIGKTTISNIIKGQYQIHKYMVFCSSFSKGQNL